MGEGTADLDPIHGGHDQPPGPVRAEDPVSFQPAGDGTPQREDRLGRLALQRIADGVVTARSNALRHLPRWLNIYLLPNGKYEQFPVEDEL